MRRAFSVSTTIAWALAAIGASLTRSASVVVAIGLSALPAVAQTSANGAIRGHVRDATGAVLVDTTITAVSATAPAPLSAVSDSEGYYRLLELPPGEYELTAERAGFARFVRQGIAVRAGLNLAVDIDMVLGGQTDTVSVKADTPMLESSSAVQAINIGGEFQRDLPLTSRRDWADSLGLAPGVVSTQNGAGKVFYYLHGADFSSLVMQVDGADVASTLQNTNGYVNLSTEAIQDVQIKTGAVDASTPIGTGAVLNVVTQSGTNHFKGAVGIAYQDEGWNANNAPGGTTTAFGIAQPDASLGGPIRTDRLWFFAAYRYTNNSLGVSRTPAQLANLHALVPGFQPFTQDAAARYFFAKATAQLSRSHVVEAFWQRDRSPENAVGANWGGEFLTRDFGGIATGGRWTSVWTNSLTSRVSVAFNDKGIRAQASSDLTSRQRAPERVSFRRPPHRNRHARHTRQRAQCSDATRAEADRCRPTPPGTAIRVRARTSCRAACISSRVCVSAPRCSTRTAGSPSKKSRFGIRRIPQRGTSRFIVRSTTSPRCRSDGPTATTMLSTRRTRGVPPPD